MRSLALAAVAFLGIALPARAEEPAGPPPAVLAHQVDVRIEPDEGRLEATDRITVRRGAGGYLDLLLREGLEIRSLVVDAETRDSVARVKEDAPPGMARWRFLVPPAAAAEAVVAISYAGVIRDPVKKAGDLAFVAGDSTTGTIGPEGVFLSESSGWTPTDGGMARYDLRAHVLAMDWSVASQGRASTPEAVAGFPGTTFVHSFHADLPTDGLWLQAGKWKVERRDAGRVSIGTYLSGANAGLSKLLMDSVEEYLAQYEKLLGPYPHSKFDVVENFFSTGYGMPSATLLGGDVIARIGEAAARSGGKVPPGYLDHELVHGWWGNGVFVDYAKGNWCEALTTYCSNYLRKEWESPEAAAEHRRGVRSRFAARVRPDRDYPLRRFTGKREDFENDIGYGKGSMLFHTVRRALGDEAFFGALRDLAASFAGKRASWDDLRAAFEKRSGRHLASLMDPLLDRTGAPVLRAGPATVERDGDGWHVAGTIAQEGEPWRLAVPVAVETARETETVTVDIDGPSCTYSIRTRSFPFRVLVDPDSHCWRGFAKGERPPSLDATLGHGAGLAVGVPAGEDGTPYAPVVEALRGRFGESMRVLEGERLPSQSPAFLMGSPNESRLVEAFLPLAGISPVAGGISVHGQTFRGDDVAVLASFRPVKGNDASSTLYFGLSPAALVNARRVFYYGGDGVVVFKGGRPVLRLPPEGDESSRASLLEAALPGADPARAQAMVEALAAPVTAGRLAGSPGGEKAIEILETALMVEDGIAAVRQPFSFEVVEWDGSPCADPDHPDEVGTAAPFCFSPAASAWVDRPALVRVKEDATPEDLFPAIHRAEESGAKGVIVLGPPAPPAALADYLLFPSRLPAADRKRLEDRAAKGGDGDPVRFVEGKRSRLLLPDPAPGIPIVYLGQGPTRSALSGRIRAPLTRRRIESANLFALVPGSDPALRDEAILIGCHHDHLGEGFPGADDDASGCAALREAARVLKARRAWLGRSVIVAFFGAEEWGLRGSRAFAAAPPPSLPVVRAAFTLDTVGGRGVPEAFVVGRSVYPALARAAARALAAEGFAPGADIDRFAFAWGSDHFALHAAGIPAIDLFSGDYSMLHTRADTPDRVDPGKVVRAARAAAAFAVAFSRGEVPR